MEKAIITKSGSGWLLTLENGKSIQINWTNIPEDWSKAKILVKIDDKSDQPIELVNGEKILVQQSQVTIPIFEQRKRKILSTNHVKDKAIDIQPNKNSQKQNNNLNLLNNISAKSPYNFVPLNDIVVYPKEQKVFFNTYDPKRNTGYIGLKIENKTPLFIRGKKEDFLLINGKPIIPGSSLRGLIRNMVGILSYSKVEFINDSRFFFRSFADSALRLRSEYNKEITKHTNVGILFQKKDRNYVLVPSVLIDTISDISVVNDCIYDPHTNTWKLYSGSMPGGQTAKSHNYEIEGRKIDDTDAIVINWDDDIIKEYKEDLNRKGFDVLEALKTNPKYKTNGIPMFYQIDSDENICSFGNTKNYRLPYHETVRDHLHECHNIIKLIKGKNNEKIEKLDFVNLIFGKTNENYEVERTTATRVYFEDSVCLNPIYSDNCLLKILASPKPTSFQLYLEQPNGVNTEKNNLKHWNDPEAKIRGFKQYWHKTDNFGYKEIEGVQKTPSHPDPIKPLCSNNMFQGKIRFENLTNEELGALVFALDLPSDCCHKIGMGKPLGLGTIQIKPTVVIEDRTERYDNLLIADGKWFLPLKSGSIDFKKSFSDYILQEVDIKKNDLWETERLSQLKSMLEYDEAINKKENWLEETRYMNLGEFKRREVLDTPKSILAKFKKP
jgi:CRISPR/Cas system CSM-associated protein Csm3 (group 7 of RAMP superfamily)